MKDYRFSEGYRPSRIGATVVSLSLLTCVVAMVLAVSWLNGTLNRTTFLQLALQADISPETQAALFGPNAHYALTAVASSNTSTANHGKPKSKIVASSGDEVATPAGPVATAVQPAVVPSPATTEAIQTLVPPPPAPVAWVNNVGSTPVNLRAGQGVSSGVIGQMASGERAAVIGRSADSNWLKVFYNGNAVWLYGEAVSQSGNIAAAPVE